MTGVQTLPFTRLPHPGPRLAAEREDILANPGFGKAFTDHMALVRWSADKGWHDAEVGPRRAIELDPACAVLHYAQEIFEGLKAYRAPDGGVALFRPEANARRFAASARRLAMPEIPEQLFLDSIRALVEADRDWVPSIPGSSLYLRPFMFASEAFLGVRPAQEYLYMVIASPAGAYFKGDAPAVTLWVSDDFSRAGPGGTGAAKCGGNYAASLLPQSQAIAEGCDQVVFLDAAEHRWVEELGGMNVFFVFEDGSVQTPPLGGTILPGITRESLIRLMRDSGRTVREERYSIDQWEADAKSGRLREVFACGTAAVVTPVGRVRGTKVDFSIGNGGSGDLTGEMKARLVGIQRGEQPDPHGWVTRLF